MKEALPMLSPSERAELSEHLHALEKGMSVEEFRRMHAVIMAAVNDPSPGLALEEIRADIESLKLGNVPSDFLFSSVILSLSKDQFSRSTL